MWLQSYGWALLKVASLDISPLEFNIYINAKCVNAINLTRVDYDIAYWATGYTCHVAILKRDAIMAMEGRTTPTLQHLFTNPIKSVSMLERISLPLLNSASPLVVDAIDPAMETLSLCLAPSIYWLFLAYDRLGENYNGGVFLLEHANEFQGMQTKLDRLLKKNTHNSHCSKSRVTFTDDQTLEQRLQTHQVTLQSLVGRLAKSVDRKLTLSTEEEAEEQEEEKLSSTEGGVLSPSFSNRNASLYEAFGDLAY
jgi:hypothetical protein